MIYAGQGPIYIGDFNATTLNIENEVAVGCGNRSLKLAMSRETVEMKESCSGQRLTLAEYETSKSANATLEIEQFDKDMLAMALYGAATAVTGSTVTAEAMPTMVANGVYHTKHPKVSSVVVKDSAGTPATLVADTHYKVDNADYGRIIILDLASFTQPFKVDYTYAAYSKIKPFSIAAPVKALRFDGFSTVDNQKVRVILPKIQFSPASEFNFLGTEAAVLSLEGKLLYPSIDLNDPVLGNFGSIDLL